MTITVKGCILCPYCRQDEWELAVEKPPVAVCKNPGCHGVFRIPKSATEAGQAPGDREEKAK